MMVPIHPFGVEPPQMPEPVQMLPYQHAITCNITGVPYPDYVNDGKSHAMCFGPQWMFDEVADEQRQAGMLMGALVAGGIGLVVGGAIGFLVGGSP